MLHQRGIRSFQAGYEPAHTRPDALAGMSRARGQVHRVQRVVCAQAASPMGPQDPSMPINRGQQAMPYQQQPQQQYMQGMPGQQQPGVQDPYAQPMGGASQRPAPTSLQRINPVQQQQQSVFIEMSQVVGKQVITRTTGRNLGVIGTMWVDPVRYQVVSLDLDDKKGVGGNRVCNFPISRLTQIGDVVLVHDEEVLYDQPLDGRYGFYILMGMEVRTRSGEFLGKVRDFTFSPDDGSISRIVYDDFGLSFLPVTFFDTYSLPMSDVISLGVGGLIVSEEARYRERRESPGLFAAIPSLLRSLNTGTSRVAGALTDGYRSDNQVAGYLPQGYTYAQWENDVRRWEQETGLSYDQYTRMMAQQQAQQARLPAASGRALPAPSNQYRGAQPAQQQQQQQQPQYGYGNTGYAQPQQQFGQYAPQQQPQQQLPYNTRAPAQQQQAAPQRGAAYDPRARPGLQQPQQPQYPAQGVAPRQQQQLPQQQQQYRPPASQPAPQQAAWPGAGQAQGMPRQPALPQGQFQQPAQSNSAPGQPAGNPQLQAPAQDSRAMKSPEPEGGATGQPVEQWLGADAKRVPEMAGDSGWAGAQNGMRNGQ